MLSPLGPMISNLANRAAFAKGMRKVFGPDTQPDDDLIDTFWSLIETNRGHTIWPKLFRYMVERRENRRRWVGAIQSSRLPLKLIDGAVDPISGAHMAARYRELVPEADATMLDRIGHYPQVESPDAVLAAYFEFRARQDAT